LGTGGDPAEADSRSAGDSTSAGLGRRTLVAVVALTVAWGAIAVVARFWYTASQSGRLLDWSMVGLTIAVLWAGTALIAAGAGSRLSGRGQIVGEVVADAGVALITGAVIGLVLFFAQNGVEEDRFTREQRRDNVRFVREVVVQPDAPTKPFATLDLRDADLGGLDLSDADLSDAILADAYLADADLSGANLSHADLSDAYLADAELSGANLYRADLTEAYLVGADLSGANLGGADLTLTALTDANLTGARCGRNPITHEIEPTRDDYGTPEFTCPGQ
jgi:Pentapeptide repeats (8 copies)